VSTIPSYGPLVESRCPQCDYKLNAATKLAGEEGKPEEGDNCVCLNCGQVLTYQADLTLRKATAYEIRDLLTEPEAWRVIETVQTAIRQRGRIA
jgi:hypothetical protein